MNLRFFRLMVVIPIVPIALFAPAVDRPEVTYKIFQFTADRIPRIDGSTDDWAMVPDEYAIGMDQLVDDEGGHTKPDSKNLDAKVRIGWVAGLNRLYFLYEAYDNYWDFSDPGLRNDTFEIVVDGDASGGPLIDKGHRELWTAQQVGASSATPDNRISVEENHWAIHGVHAQNYHIFTPARDKDWCMAWSSATWIKELPFANAAYRYSFKPGEPGRLTLEFWITPFDYAGPEGPQRAVESVLSENKIIGLSWAIIDYDGPKERKEELLESLTQTYHVWQRFRFVRVQAHASGTAVPQAHRGSVVLQSRGYGPAPGRIQGPLAGQDHELAVELRRRRDLDGTESDA